MCGYFELSKNPIGWVVSKSRNVNGVYTSFTTKGDFGLGNDILDSLILPTDPVLGTFWIFVFEIFSKQKRGWSNYYTFFFNKENSFV